MKSLVYFFAIVGFLSCTAKKTLQYSILDIRKTTNDTIIPKNTKDMILYTYRIYNSDLQKKVDNNLIPFDKLTQTFKAEDGSFFTCHYGETERYFYIIPSGKAFYSYMYYYYPSGKLYKIHQYTMFSNFVRIGKWLTFDENGKIIQEEDQDKKFLNVNYEQVLLFMQSKDYIDLTTGKNRDRVSFQYFEKSKVWKATFRIEEKQNGDKEYIHYYISAKTGEVIETRNETVHYNPMDLPFLRDKPYKEKYSDNNWETGQFIDTDKEIYKTHNSISYTRAEWQAYEEKEYEEYCKRTGKTYIPKDQTTVSKNKGRFEADDTDLGTPKPKKGFWDKLLG